MSAGLHVDARGQHRHDDGFGAAHQFVEFGAVNAGRRIDDQNLGVARHVAQAIFECGDAADRRQIGRTHRQPIETGALRVVVRDANLVPVAGEEYGDVGGKRALAAAAFRVQYHDVAHNPPALLFL